MEAARPAGRELSWFLVTLGRAFASFVDPEPRMSAKDSAPTTPVSLVCQGAYRARSVVFRPRAGLVALTVACHAVFELAPGESRLHRASLSPVEGDDERRLVEPWGAVAPRKRWPEVVVVGHAPPSAGPIAARVVVGDLDKSLLLDAPPGGPSRKPLRGLTRSSAPWGARPFAAQTEALAPGGLGPLDPSAPERRAHLPEGGVGWDAERWMDHPLPSGFDAAYFDVAPRDQALSALTGHERISLEHLHPRLARFTTQLVAPAPRALCSAAGVETSVPLRCDTLVIDADQGLAVLVFRGELTLDHPGLPVFVLVSAGDLGSSVTGTLSSIGGPKAGGELPFRPASGEPPPPSSQPEAGYEPRRRTDTVGTGHFQHGPALPFQPERGAEEEAEGPPTVRRLAAAAALAALTPVPLPPLAAPVAPPLFTLAPAPVVPPPVLAPVTPPEEPASPIVQPVAPLSPAEEIEPKRAEPEPKAIEAAPESSPPIRRYPLPRCATIAARVASRPDDEAAILEAQGLDQARWAALEIHWNEAMNRELDRGKQRLRLEYDAAFLAALEVERGAELTPADYAKLAVAAERGGEEAALAELELPAGVMMRIRRVWLQRTVKDPKAAQEVRAALRKEAE